MKIGSLLVGAALFVSCSTHQTWIYKANPKPVNAPALSKDSVIIVPFNDQRQSNNDNKTALYMVPLMPFGWANYEAPEGVPRHITSGLWQNYKPVEDYAKALAIELENAELFREASFDNKKGDKYYIQGTIVNTGYKGKMFSYLLSIWGPLLWFVGLPAVTVENSLTLELSLMNHKTKKTLFSKKYTATPFSEVGWIYDLPNDFRYAEMVKEIYGQFVTDLKTTFPKGLKD
ncbi:hypothetical protein BES34_019935 [Leptospira inadai serovar Lyme]|nr:hypothetical protein BES34_019935 [Leptospira inadai serovar Lyme]